MSRAERLPGAEGQLHFAQNVNTPGFELVEMG
jgi:hypothetical protein